MQQPFGPSACKLVPRGRTARGAMPPSYHLVRQPPTLINLQDLGVERESFQLAASSQGCSTTPGVNLNEVGFLLATKAQLEEPGFGPSVGLFVNAMGMGMEVQYHGKPMVRVVVLHVGSRDASLRSAIAQVMRAFSQKGGPTAAVCLPGHDDGTAGFPGGPLPGAGMARRGARLRDSPRGGHGLALRKRLVALH